MVLQRYLASIEKLEMGLFSSFKVLDSTYLFAVVVDFPSTSIVSSLRLVSSRLCLSGLQLLCSPCTLLQQELFPLCQHGGLPIINALQPVSKATTDRTEERVSPEALLVEQRHHLETQLPRSDGHAEAGPKDDSGNHLM